MATTQFTFDAIVGKWNGIAHNIHQAKELAVNSTKTYGGTPSGLYVIETRTDSKGKVSQSNGTVTFPNAQDNTQMLVTYPAGGIFSSPTSVMNNVVYFGDGKKSGAGVKILALGSSDRKYFRVLSTAQAISVCDLAEAEKAIASKGYDVSDRIVERSALKSCDSK